MVIIRRVSQMKSVAKWSFSTLGYFWKMVLSAGFSMWLSRAMTPLDFMVLVSWNRRDSRSL
ncbi:hypothetical protein D3C85_1300990 [compost metagenome]